MKYQVIGSVQQVADVDFKGDVALARKNCNPAEFSNTNPATGKRWEALVAGGQVWPNKSRAERFRHRCESSLAFLSGKTGEWQTPTFVTVPVNGNLVRQLNKARKAAYAEAK